MVQWSLKHMRKKEKKKLEQRVKSEETLHTIPQRARGRAGLKYTVSSRLFWKISVFFFSSIGGIKITGNRHRPNHYRPVFFSANHGCRIKIFPALTLGPYLHIPVWHCVCVCGFMCLYSSCTPDFYFLFYYHNYLYYLLLFPYHWNILFDKQQRECNPPNIS